MNFFIFTYFNRKFRCELARVCFHTKKTRDPMLCTASHQSFPRTNSYVRTAQQNFEVSQNSNRVHFPKVKLLQKKNEKGRKSSGHIKMTFSHAYSFALDNARKFVGISKKKYSPTIT